MCYCFAFTHVFIWSYGVVVSISGCDPLDPGSTPGTANFLGLSSKNQDLV